MLVLSLLAQQWADTCRGRRVLISGKEFKTFVFGDLSETVAHAPLDGVLCICHPVLWVLQLGLVEQASCSCAISSAAADRSNKAVQSHVSET